MTRDRPNRRDVLRYAAGTAVVAGVAGAAACGGGAGGGGRAAAPPAPDPGPAPGPAAPEQSKTRTILILGGTGFLGPHLVEAARGRGHTLTLFNRGKTNPHLFPEVEKLQGDRDGVLDALRGRSWDAVIDTSGYVPRVVKMSADLLAEATKQYLFVSTISVYAGMDRPGADEDAPLATLPDPTTEDVPQHYGALKAACEVAAGASMPGRVTVVRPGLIVGPRDPTGRFTYWPVRVSRGGEILAPGSGGDPVQYIDARDLAGWMIDLVERGTTGVFNALGPADRLEMRGMLEGIAEGVAPPEGARFTWVPAELLEKEKVAPWSDLPVWIPAEGDYAGAGTTSNARAVAAGLTFRPVAETARDTLAWVRSLPEDEQKAVTRGGLSPEREAEVLARFHAQQKKQQKKRR